MEKDGNTDVVFRLQTDKAGLSMVLGPLELTIMQVLWDADRPPLTNKEIKHALSEVGRHLTVSAIGTTMHRLAEKGLVCETRPDGLYQYHARFTEDELEFYVVELVFARLKYDWPDHLTDLGVVWDDK